MNRKRVICKQKKTQMVRKSNKITGFTRLLYMHIQIQVRGTNIWWKWFIVNMQYLSGLVL